MMKGFSLVELLSVLILLGILSVVAVARIDIDPFRSAGFNQELRAALRFAQKFAITSGCDVQVSVVAATDSYSLNLRGDAVANAAACLTATGAFAVPLPNPAGSGAFSGTAPAGIDISNDLSFFYDRQGRPSIAGGSINIDAQTITVEAVTGFVY